MGATQNAPATTGATEGNPMRSIRYQRMQAKRLVSTDGLSREDWLLIRRSGIGGSDLPVILGLSPYKSPMELAAEKLGLVDPPADTRAMRRGRYLEDAVARLWADEEGRTIRRVHAVLQSRTNSLMLANVDRLVAGPQEVLEIKTSGGWAASAWRQDEPPAHASMQLMHYLGVTGLDSGYLVAYVDGDLRPWRVWRDDALITSAWDQASNWWEQYIRAGVLPEPTEADTGLLARLYDASEPGREVDLPDNARDLLAAYRQAGEEEKAAGKRKAEAANRLKAFLGEAEIGLLDGQVAVTWKAFERRLLDTEALRREAPEVAARFERSRTERRLLVKGGGTEDD